jgi:hypothetical protein
MHHWTYATTRQDVLGEHGGGLAQSKRVEAVVTVNMKPIHIQEVSESVIS